MTRRFDTRPEAAPSFASLHHILRLGALLGLFACQGQGAPMARAEPSARQELAPAAAAAAKPPAATGKEAAPTPSAAPEPVVGLAKYEQAPTGAVSSPVASSPDEGSSVSPAKGSSVAAPAADSPKAAPGKMTQGEVVTGEPFSAWLQAVSPVAAGSPATVEAVLVAKPPYHCNAEYPHKFKLAAAPAGLSYPEQTVKGMQVTAERSVLRIPVQAQSPGNAKITGTLSFSVCTEERCLVEKRELSMNLEVK